MLTPGVALIAARAYGPGRYYPSEHGISANLIWRGLKEFFVKVCVLKEWPSHHIL